MNPFPKIIFAFLLLAPLGILSQSLPFFFVGMELSGVPITPEEQNYWKAENLPSWNSLQRDILSTSVIDYFSTNSVSPESHTYIAKGISGVADHGGYALDFDGTDDFVSLPNESSFDFTTAMTVEAWIKVGVFDKGWQAIVTKGDAAWRLHRYNTSDNISFGTGGLSNTDLQGTTNVNDGQWHHVACVFDGSTKILYVDGKLDASIAVTGTIATSNAAVYFGENSEATSRHFNGSIDEVRIWDDARTQAEIQANMHRELAGSEANLVAYYQMSDGSGTSLTDNTSNGHTGTLNNSPSWVTSAAHAGPGMALDFDGGDDFAYAALNASSSSTITLECWLSFNSLTDQQNMMNVHSTANSLIRLVPYKTSGNSISLFIYDGSDTYIVPTTFSVTQTDEWHHLVFIYDAGTVEIYADGNQVGSASSQGSFNTGASSQFSMGADFDGSAAGFHSNVKMDEVRIWSDVRTEAEIRANMYRTLDGDEAGLLSYYRCDQQPESGNTTVYDLSNSGHNATLSLMDATTDWVSASPFNTWIGSEDGDWSNGDNWSLGSAPTTEDVGVFDWDNSNSPSSADISGRHFYVGQGVSMSATGDLTLSGDYYNAGTFTTTGDVTFSGSSAQTIRGTGTSTFGGLIINNSAGVTMEQDVEATSGLTLTAGLLQLNSQTLTLGTGASLSGSPGNTNHVVATSGTLRKEYSGTGSFSFPVGDGTVYTPISLNFTSGVFASAYADVDLTAGKHPNNTSSNHYIERYWTVSSSGISSFDCTVTATYDDADIQGTEAEYYVGKWNGASWTLLGAATPASNQISGSVSSFSDFTAGELGVFPVEWLDFTATPQQQTVLLDWSTAQEQNSHFFAIERSTDEQYWREIGQQSAAGNSQDIRQYAFTDQKPEVGLNYYRLRQVDLDGTHSFSEVRSVRFQELGIRVYPNPVENTLHLDLPAGDWNAELLDGLGRSILSVEQVGSELDLSQLPAGTYQLRLTGSEGQQWNTTVVK